MNPGDTVEIITKDSTYVGKILPRPEILEKGILTLKLDNGYNIGISESDITSSKVIEKAKFVEKKVVESKFDKKLPTVAILSTGGTISSSVDYTSGGVKAVEYTANDFIQMCPDVANKVNLKAKAIAQTMSEDIDLEQISHLAKDIKAYIKENAEIKGIVLTCGTDMLHYISAGLSFLLKGLSIPVIITAAQRSIDRGSSDAYMNLSCAIIAAAKWDGAEVVSCMHGTSDDSYCLLIRGSKVRKMHTSRRDAFRPINILPFAKVHYSSFKIESVFDKYDKRSINSFEKHIELSNDVEMVYIYPGVDGSVIEHHIKNKKKGLIIAGTALGHVPTEGKGNMLPYLEKAVDAGLVVVIATQTLYGRTHPYVYTNLRKLSINLGCIFASDMLPETAYMKLSYLFGKYKDIEKIKKEFAENIVGEINPILDEESFLY